MLFETVQRVAVLAVLALVFGLVWYYEGRGRWRETLTRRFVYGVPWGSLLTILLVLGVYLFVQSGLESWTDPAVTPFRSWSYSYLLGMVAAGFTHAGPGHLTGNLLAAAVLSPLVEYAWGHYPPDDSTPDAAHEHPPPAPPADDPATAGPDTSTGDATNGDDRLGGLLSKPLTRATLLFPLGIVGVSLLTSVLARGWSLGYSGTVFFLLGVAVVLLPLVTVVSMVVLGAGSAVFSALQTPVLRVTAGSGPPAPPSWAGVNVQAHLLGFLLGVLLAFALLRRRNRLPDPERLALAVGLVVLVRSLWAYSTSSGNTFTRWQAIGVVFVLFLTALIVSLVVVENERLLDAVTVRNVAVGPVTLRGVVAAGLVVVTLLIALSSVQPNLVGMDEHPVPDGPALQVDDYTVTYAEDTPHGRLPVNGSGVIVVSEQRQVWTTAVDDSRLAHSGESTATVGGVGWRETVAAERTGWQVAGNDTVYTVTLEHDGRTVDAFQSPPSRADTRLAGHNLSVAATPDGFRLHVSRGRERVGSTPLPDVNATTTVPLRDSAPLNELTVAVEKRGGSTDLFVDRQETRVLVATAEQ